LIILIIKEFCSEGNAFVLTLGRPMKAEKGLKDFLFSSLGQTFVNLSDPACPSAPQQQAVFICKASF
jgi:hypothetical protein